MVIDCNIYKTRPEREINDCTNSICKMKRKASLKRREGAEKALLSILILSVDSLLMHELTQANY